MAHKFHYMSDIHLEFGAPLRPLPKGENLILAGDITVLRCLNEYMHDDNSKRIRDRTIEFFDTAIENFKRVFYLKGNHEPYNFNIDEEDYHISKYLPKQLIHLNNSSYEIDEKTVIMGGTLWTNMNNNSSIDKKCVAYGMNDFRIVYSDKHGVFSPDEAYDKHVATMEFLTSELDKHKDKNCIVATHHSPTLKGLNKKHAHSDINAGYASNLEKFIKGRPQIKYWVFGHTHIQKQIEIGTTNVVSNAQGYVGYEDCAVTFDPNTSFEV